MDFRPTAGICRGERRARHAGNKPVSEVHAPHTVGYFRTTLTSFELARRPDGGTEIIERTFHQLKLDPAYYWLPMARWIVRENNARVLAHIRHQAEQRPD
jgi:hypothetical protein